MKLITGFLIGVTWFFCLSPNLIHAQSTSSAQLVSQLVEPSIDTLRPEALSANQQLLLAGNSLEAALISAFNSGPSSVASSGVNERALSRITQLQTWITANGASAGFDPATIAVITSVSPTQFANDSETAYNLSFQKKALIALGPIAGPTGKSLLAQLSQTAGSPFQSVAQQVLASSFQSVSAGFEAKGGSLPNFELTATVGLQNGTTLNPAASGMIVRIGTFETSLPAKAFKANKTGSFTYEGTASSVSGTTFKIEVLVAPVTKVPSGSLPGTYYVIHAEGAGIDLSTLARPVEVSLMFGSIGGTSVGK